MSVLVDIERASRSEFVRLRRLWKLPVLTVVLSIVATVLTFSGGRAGPGAREATTEATQLSNADGIVGWLDLAGNFIGLLALVTWALSIARDLQTGSIRVLLVNQARRGRYLAGKIVALALASAATVIVSVLACVAVSYAAAAPNDVATAAWQWSYVASAVLNTALAAIAWGAVGAALAMVTRSSAAAIAGGIGYMLLGENLLASVWSSAGEWLPSGVIAAVLEGGSVDVGYLRAALFTAAYAVSAALIAALVLQRRDISD